jgi:D-beta-D-heptose 7-phosphate kinase/D-beta-D-heptose 1-phosphate adenosyltransferase
MLVRSKELLEIVDRFAGVPVTVVGDLIVDHYIMGSVDRISPEAPVVVVHVAEENKRLGGAANVANNLLSLGASASMCGVVGDDESGRELISLMEADGINVEGVLVASDRPTIVKTRVIAHAQQVVRVDREEVSDLPLTLQSELARHVEKSYSKSQGQQSKGIIVSDYAKGAICPAICDALGQGYAKGDLGASTVPVLIDPKMPNFPLYSAATVIKPNKKEAEEACGIKIRARSDAIAAGVELLKRWNTEMLLITLGEMGMVLVSTVDGAEPEVEVDTEAREVYDVSGAGDTVSAVFLLALTVGATPRQAAVLSNVAAGVVVSEVGTAPIRLPQLKDAISRMGTR